MERLEKEELQQKLAAMEKKAIRDAEERAEEQI